MRQRADHPLLRPVLARLHQTVESHVGAPCDLHLPERDLLLAVVRRQPIPQVTLCADDVPLGETGARIATLSVHLDHVTLRGPRRRPEITADGGSFVATFLDDALATLVDLPPVVERVWLLSGGVRVNMVAGVAVTCDLRLEGGQIVLSPRMPELLDRHVPWHRLGRAVPDLPFGAELETLEVDGSQVVATGSLRAEDLQWSVGSSGSERPAAKTTT
jgi:hypothetical protein